ncbi:MAG: bifunctional 4-hydroxy-2-oxoglutarate aldolase/2-dehydro-3-deoxy-phosphogluconate aldolase [Bacteroidales bacterium]|nr:bifunctional 4-hydroxy-2-oxoglutarate aldolase/2-dehydro-3-deoxy-phosphogluconate aldolase [Bacteroidales bacterium]MBN2762231.1 bifunctional 4-hydroxy-2-oxoglutarate aldolase/2-dehydro-3-deoxy-phosphogluconate aldolase [Bacteroidales bacterium]
MARFTRLETALKMKESGLIPVFYNADINLCKEVVSACFRGGARLFEFTNRGDFAHEVFRELNQWVLQEIPDMIMGVGSVVDAATAGLYIQSGANFVVSPILNEEMARICNRRKILWSPGCGSVSEISRAEELGAEIVKIFPGAEVGGPRFVQMVKGPMPWTSIMPTGGVDATEESLSAWFKAGVYCVGMGSKLITKDMVKNRDYEAVEANIRKVLAIIASIKG